MLALVSWFAPPPLAAQANPPAAPEFQNLAAAVTVERGRTCLDSTELVEHISTWLGSDSVTAPLSIQVHGSPHFTRTVWFQIQREGKTLAERRFEPAPARCADLHAAVGLAIALALKASLLDSLIGAHSQPEAPYRLVAHALGGMAVVPGPAPGIELSLQRWFADRFAVRISALALLGPYGDFQQDQGHFRTWLPLGRLDLCSRLANFHSLSLSACVGLAAGAMYVTGQAFPVSRRTLIPYVAVANAFELDISLSTHWSLNIELDVLVPLRRTSFVVRDQTDAVLATHDLAAAGALLAVGPSFKF